jgi:NAD(P)-dependent dehydrogenase (short-subunit alcohol dehydrogenase family)
MATSVDRGAATQEATGSLRYLFDRLADRPLGPRTVSNAIVESWQRSADAGLDPHAIRPPYDPDVDTDGLLCRAAAPSMAAVSQDLGDVEASLAKGALTNLSKSLSKEFGGKVRVNTISPGPVQTDLWLGDDGVAATVGRATGTSANAVASHAAADASTGRFTYPQEIADLVLLLASDRAGNITGSDYVIDGGLIKTL